MCASACLRGGFAGGGSGGGQCVSIDEIRRLVQRPDFSMVFDALHGVQVNPEP